MKAVGFLFGIMGGFAFGLCALFIREYVIRHGRKTPKHDKRCGEDGLLCRDCRVLKIREQIKDRRSES